MFKFTQITDKLKYPLKYKATLSTMHSKIIAYVLQNFKNTASYKRRIISAMNSLSYYVLTGDNSVDSWDEDAPLSVEIVDPVVASKTLKDVFIDIKNIVWDLEENMTPYSSEDSKQPVQSCNKIRTVVSIAAQNEPPTPKENLYIKSPTIPQFDTNSPWLDVKKDGYAYTIYRTLPLIPTSQREISVTTDLSKMTDHDILKLFPNHNIHTRAPIMYENYEDLQMDADVGIIFPIERFTVAQIRDNIIRYPHLYKLMRHLNGEFVSFYSNIEIDGEIYKTAEVWDELSDSKHIPRNPEFIKEYVVRRYLLERDILGTVHRYPMFGTLDPFLTLFTAPQDYSRIGYDPLEIGRMCVSSRINYLQSRNPVIRAVYGDK